MEYKNASPPSDGDLAAWQGRQVEYTIPVTSMTPPLSSAQASAQPPEDVRKIQKIPCALRYASYACVSLLISGIACSYAMCRSSMSINTLFQTARASLTLNSRIIKDTLVSGGASTLIGLGALAGALVISSIIAIMMRLAAKQLPHNIGFMSANLLVDGKLTLFEFFGDSYGETLNAFRTRVFQAVLPAKTFVRKMSREEILAEMRKASPQANPTDAEIEYFHKEMLHEAKLKDLDKGPTLSQLVGCDRAFSNGQQRPFNVLEELAQLKDSLNDPSILSDNEMTQFAAFIQKFGDQKLFAFLHGINPNSNKGTKCEGASRLLKFDHHNQTLTLPLLNGVAPVEASGLHELKSQFLQALFQPEVLRTLKEKKNYASDAIMKIIREDLDLTLLKDIEGYCVTPDELQFFSTVAGQLLFFWLYHVEDWELALTVTTIEELNQAKKELETLVGTPQQHAEEFVQNLITSHVSVLAVQECGPSYAKALEEHGFIDPFKIKRDSTVFLRKDHWKDIEPIKQSTYPMVLATDKKTGDRFLHASIHTRPGGRAISEVVNYYNKLKAQPGNENLILLIGADTNTKEAEEIAELQASLQKEGLQMTDYGSTTIKIRALTPQQEKAGERINAPGDHVITSRLKGYRVIDRLLGGKRTRAGIGLTLPNVKHPSDHLTVQLTIQKIWKRTLAAM